MKRIRIYGTEEDKARGFEILLKKSTKQFGVLEDNIYIIYEDNILNILKKNNIKIEVIRNE